MNYIKKYMVVYMKDQIYIVKHERMKYDTMKVIEDINRYEMRCDDMMNVQLPT